MTEMGYMASCLYDGKGLGHALAFALSGVRATFMADCAYSRSPSLGAMVAMMVEWAVPLMSALQPWCIGCKSMGAHRGGTGG